MATDERGNRFVWHDGDTHLVTPGESRPPRPVDAVPPRQRDRYLTVDEVADLARCHPTTVRRAYRTGHLVAYRPTTKVLIRESDARAWIEGTPAAIAPRPSQPRPMPKGRISDTIAQIKELERRAREQEPPGAR